VAVGVAVAGVSWVGACVGVSVAGSSDGVAEPAVGPGVVVSGVAGTAVVGAAVVGTGVVDVSVGFGPGVVGAGDGGVPLGDGTASRANRSRKPSSFPFRVGASGALVGKLDDPVSPARKMPVVCARTARAMSEPEPPT
jgi:hypothetical protein